MTTKIKTTKTAVKPVAKKTVKNAEKVAPKKASAKKVVAEKVAPKKAPAKKIVAAKVAPKKAPAKKVVAVKVAPKKAPAKKVVAVKVAPKKAPAKKVVAAKVAPKKASFENKTLELILNFLDAGKAENIVALEVGSKTSFTDYMVIAQGTSGRHLNALAKTLESELKTAKMPCHIEATNGSPWVLIDAGSVIVNIMTSEMRDYYKLEELWK